MEVGPIQVADEGPVCAACLSASLAPASSTATVFSASGAATASRAARVSATALPISPGDGPAPLPAAPR